MKRVVTFGEIMGRLTPSGFLRFRQSVPGSLNVSFAGAEANVAASLALFGVPTTFVTSLPDHDLSRACESMLHGCGVGTEIVWNDDGRLGLYFLETGANQRPSRVLYDRAHSSISLTPSDAYDWKSRFAEAGWFHVTGITPALSQAAADASISAAAEAKDAGLTVSCDLNFRGKLWSWEAGTDKHELAGRVMRELLPHVDVLIANEEDCGDVLGIRADSVDVHSGNLDVDRYPEVAKRVGSEFPNIKLIATTLRQSISASHNNWGAMLYDSQSKNAMFAPTVDGQYQPYEIRNIVDRVGGGDSFAAGLIYGLLTERDPSDSLNFAVAASCLAHSLKGDFNFSTVAEVEALVTGSGSGRVVR